MQVADHGGGHAADEDGGDAGTGAILAVNDKPFSDDLIKTEITAAKGGSAPVRLLVKTADRLRMVDLAWNGGLRYPRFEKTGSTDTPLDRLLAPRP